MVHRHTRGRARFGGHDCSPDLDQHGLTVYFHSDRMGTTDDIFIATRAAASDPFGPPTVVDVVSSSMDEGDPT